ncbi:hypothetical protein IFR05_000611 [Cadophora sp. M221]|nr:hypothetical protein IFR05_000611 [Cadophora sp. M221]
MTSKTHTRKTKEPPRFKPFATLPIELQCRIWELACPGSRLVEVYPRPRFLKAVDLAGGLGKVKTSLSMRMFGLTLRLDMAMRVGSSRDVDREADEWEQDQRRRARLKRKQEVPDSEEELDEQVNHRRVTPQSVVGLRGGSSSDPRGVRGYSDAGYDSGSYPSYSEPSDDEAVNTNNQIESTLNGTNDSNGPVRLRGGLASEAARRSAPSTRGVQNPRRDNDESENDSGHYPSESPEPGLETSSLPSYDVEDRWHCEGPVNDEEPRAYKPRWPDS